MLRIQRAKFKHSLRLLGMQFGGKKTLPMRGSSLGRREKKHPRVMGILSMYVSQPQKIYISQYRQWFEIIMRDVRNTKSRRVGPLEPTKFSPLDFTAAKTPSFWHTVHDFVGNKDTSLYQRHLINLLIETILASFLSFLVSIIKFDEGTKTTKFQVLEMH